MTLSHLTNEKALKTLLGPQSYIGDPRVYLAETPFVTVQGEGPNAGKNTLFVRFFGCNLANSCGVDWCDSGHSFYTNKEMDEDEYGEKIYPDKPDRLTYADVEQMYTAVFENNGLAQYNNIVFTGGEPMLWQITIAQLIRMLRDRFERTVSIEIETNGTIPVETELTDWFRLVHFNISPKVHVAKKFPLIAQLSNIRGVADSSFEAFDHEDWILKFVYEGKRSQDEINECVGKYNVSNDHIYLMPEGTTRAKQLASMATCAEYCVNKGYNFSPRLHVLIWDECRNV